LKILFLDHTAQLSGGELALLALAGGLDRARFGSTVLLFSDGPLAAALRDVGAAVEILPLADSVRGAGRGSLGVGSLAKFGAVLSSATFIFRLARHIRAAKPDIVHCNSLKADILGGIAARLAGAKVIWHIRDRIEKDYLPAPVVKVFRFLARHVPHYIIANSHGTLETLHLPASKPRAVVYSGIAKPEEEAMECTTKSQRHEGQGSTSNENLPQRHKDTKWGVELGVRNEKSESVKEVYPGLAGMDAFPVSPSRSDFVSWCLRGEHPSPVVTLIGRISPWKGQDIFIHAAAEVLKTFPECRFQIVGSALFGEDALEDELKQLAAALGVSDRIEFLGFRKDVPEIISASSLVVHASTVPEPFGQVIIQAMAAGKPVVATRGGGVLEIVVDGVTGLLVPMKDVHAMAEAIGKILSDPVKAGKMGAAGKERFLEKFTIEKTVEKVQEVYAAFWNEVGSKK
jgi:glycosyltransferase involved in cell wall biosynthesis